MNWTISQTVDLANGYTPIVWPNALMVSGDVGAHTWRLTVLDNGVPADLSGATITGSFLRADGNTVLVSGSVSGNIASVTLTNVCYAVEGKMKGTIKMTKSGAVITLAAVIFTVSLFASGSIIDPGVAYADFQIDASPAGTYANLAALISADPDHSKIYITLDDGKWCYHNGTTFVAGGVYQTLMGVDATLSAPGMAADAKATGDAIAAVDNIMELDVVWITGKYIRHLDGLTANAATYSYTDFIRIPHGMTLGYRLQFGDNAGIAIYDENHNFLQGIGGGTTITRTGTINGDGSLRYVRFCSANSYTTPQIKVAKVANLQEALFTDKTLTMSGEAADAKTVGILLSNLYSWNIDTSNPAMVYAVSNTEISMSAKMKPRQPGSIRPSPSNIRNILPAITPSKPLHFRRSGKNIVDISGAVNSAFVDDGNGLFTLSKNGVNRLSENFPCYIPAGTNYCVGFSFTGKEPKMIIRYSDDSYDVSISPSNIRGRIHRTLDIVALQLYHGAEEPDGTTCTISNFMVNFGMELYQYEAPDLLDFEVSTTMYEGELDDEGILLHTKAMHTFDGSANWKHHASNSNEESNLFYLTVPSFIAESPFDTLCNYATAESTVSADLTNNSISLNTYNNSQIYLRLKKNSGITDLTTLKAALNASPLQVLLPIKSQEQVAIPALPSRSQEGKTLPMNCLALTGGEPSYIYARLFTNIEGGSALDDYMTESGQNWGI